MVELSILIALGGLLFTGLGFSLNKSKVIREDGHQNAVISTKLDSIERGVDSIRIDIRANEKRISELTEKNIRTEERQVRTEERQVRVEESLKAVYKRLDKLEAERG